MNKAAFVEITPVPIIEGTVLTDLIKQSSGKKVFNRTFRETWVENEFLPIGTDELNVDRINVKTATMIPRIKRDVKYVKINFVYDKYLNK